MLTSVFGISIKNEAWNHQDSLPVYIAGSYDFHTCLLYTSTCDGCDKWFADATGSVEITDKTSVKIPAPGHTAVSYTHLWKWNNDSCY